MLKLGDWAITGSQAIRSIIVTAAAVGLYYGIQGKIDAHFTMVDNRLDRIESSQKEYVRADVQAGQNDLIKARLDFMSKQLDDIKHAVR